jgi:effector-binding domain-containing protein
MKLITSVTELKKGDKIVKIYHNGEYEIVKNTKKYHKLLR